MPNLSEIEIRSEEIQELIGYTPGWLTRWGLSLIAILIVLFGFLTWVIKYPDIVIGEVILTTLYPPIKIVNQSSGKLISLNNSDGDRLRAGDIFGEIENPISQEEIRFLLRTIERAEQLLTSPSSKPGFHDSTFVFGHVQPLYNDFIKACRDYQELMTNKYNEEQLANLNSKISEYESLIESNIRLIAIAKKEVDNAEEKYKADIHLYKEGVLSKMDFFKEESSFHLKQQGFENLKAALTQNRITRTDLLKQKMDLVYNYQEKEREIRTIVLAKRKEIENEISQWQLKYQFISPIDGTLAILRPISINQYLKSDEIVFAVIPSNETYVIYMNLPPDGFGKVKVGQSVRIMISNYPHNEFGQLKGKVDKLSELPEKNLYRAKISLVNGLRTSFNQELEFKPEMVGVAEIITEDFRLSERIFNRFSGLFH